MPVFSGSLSSQPSRAKSSRLDQAAGARFNPAGPESDSKPVPSIFAITASTDPPKGVQPYSRSDPSGESTTQHTA